MSRRWWIGLVCLALVGGVVAAIILTACPQLWILTGVLVGAAYGVGYEIGESE